jgi:cytochrome c551/c552
MLKTRHETNEVERRQKEMRYLGVIIPAVFVFVLIGFRAQASDGQAVFDSLHCGNCHKVDTGKANPSLKEIARSYKEKEKQLTIYLNGQAESIVNPRKASMMKRYVQKTKALTPDERSALADFILSHRD